MKLHKGLHTDLSALGGAWSQREKLHIKIHIGDDSLVIKKNNIVIKFSSPNIKLGMF